MTIIDTMDTFDLIIFSVFAPFVIYYAYRLGFGSFQATAAEKMRASTICPPPDDAIESSREIERFLHGIAREIGADLSADCIRNRLKDGMDTEELVRMCHALGCELVIRKVSDTDIEE